MRMKRILMTLLCIATCFSVIACGENENAPINAPGTQTPGATESVPTVAPTSGTSAPKPTQTPSGSIAYVPQGEENYTVELDPNVEYWDCPISQVGQVFTHSLIAYLEMTDLATNPESYWRNECITVSEFKRFLQSVYDKGYVLINMNYIYEYKEDTDGVLKAYLKKSIKLPKGKKGLILSVDDVTFNPWQHGKGRVDRIVVHNGRLASATWMNDGTVDYSYDREVAPIVEQFCLEHPDFSFAGAKCMLAVNATFGLLGYRTADSFEGKKDYDGTTIRVAEEREEVKEVVTYLKNNGFYFACHGYQHIAVNTFTAAQLREEFRLWNKEMKSLIGYTSIYVYPQGAWADYGTEQHNILLSEGFHVFCGTFMGETLMNGMPKSPGVGNIFTQRCILQGNTLRLYGENGKADGTWFWKYCDPYAIYDNDARYHKVQRPA